MNKSKKIVLIIIALIAIVLSFIGGQAYAKYISKITGKGGADIASWSFKVNDNNEKMQTISLKSTINNSTLINNKIAPGTEGKFQIKLDAKDSEVGINYVIKFENETEKPRNLKFIYNSNTYNNLSDLQKDLTGSFNANGKDEEKIKILEIMWKWEFETGTTEQEIKSNDEIDTSNAEKIRDYTFDIVVSGTQIEPQQ